MTWKTAKCIGSDIKHEWPANSAPPSMTTVFVLPDEARADLASEISEEADDALKAIVTEWQKKSDHAARRDRLSTELAAANRRAAELKAATATAHRALDEAHYQGRGVADVETKLDSLSHQSAAEADRIARLQRLAKQAGTEAVAELKAMLEAKRRQEVARLDAEATKAAGELAEAAESLAGRLYVVAEARRKIQNTAAVEAFLQAAA